MLQSFGQLGAIAEVQEEFGGQALPVFGPPLTMDSPEIEGLPDFIDDSVKQRIIDATNAARAELADRVAAQVERFLD